MGRVRNLKILKGVVYAEVGVGETDNGSFVTMNVKVGRGENEAVQQALSQLDDAVAAIADRHLGEVSDRRVLDKKIEDRLTRERKRHKESLEVQRKSVVAEAANRVRTRMMRYRADGGIDGEIRKCLADALNEIEAIPAQHERRTG